MKTERSDIKKETLHEDRPTSIIKTGFIDGMDEFDRLRGSIEGHNSFNSSIVGKSQQEVPDLEEYDELQQQL